MNQNPEIEAQILEVARRVAKEEQAHTATIIQRDMLHDIADELAERIAKITGVEIGEHSSNNDPWMNAKYAADEYIALLTQPPKPPEPPSSSEERTERMVRLFERNRRAVARYDELMREGKRGHYETLFRVIHEEVERERSRGDLLQEDIDCLHMCLDDRKVPRADAGGNVYSMWGRVQLYVKQPRLGVPPGAGADPDTQAALDKLLEDTP